MLRHYHFYDRSSGHDVGIGPTPSANERPQRRLLSRLLWRPSDRCRLIKPSPTNLHKSRRRYSAIRMAGTLVNPTGSVPRRCFRRRCRGELCGAVRSQWLDGRLEERGLCASSLSQQRARGARRRSSRHFRSRANLRPPSRFASVIDRLLRNQNPLENRNNLRSSSLYLVLGRRPGNRAAILRSEIHGDGSHSCSDHRCSVRAFDDSTARRLAAAASRGPRPGASRAGWRLSGLCKDRTH